MNAKPRKGHLILRTVLVLLLVLVCIAAAYFIYLFASYHRIADNQTLEISGQAQQAPITGEEYTILSWNIGFGAYSADYSFFMDGGTYSRGFSREAVQTNVEAMAARMAEQAPDFLLVQEVDTNGTRSYHLDERQPILNQFTAYDSAFAQNYDSAYLFYPFTSPHGKNASGILTATRFAATDAVRRSLPIETGLTRFLDLDRCYSVTRIPCQNGQELCLYNVHLSAYTSDGTIANEQLQMLSADMAAEYDAGNYVLCGGDFNKDLLGNSPEIFGVSGEAQTWAQPLPEGILPDGFSVAASGNLPSCRNADTPYQEGRTFVLTVDGFIVSPNVQVLGVETLAEGFAHSDHNPVQMRFVLE